MSRAFTAAWAVLVKDLRLLWPLAGLTVALILARALIDAELSPAAIYLPPAAALAAGLFVLGLVQQDAPASLRHDWLTRPIPKLDLLSAKALLGASVVLLPAAAGPALAAARDGAAVSEALLAAVAGTGTYLALGFGLLLVAAVTSTLIESIGVLIGMFLLFVFIPPVAQKISGLHEAVLFLGSGWVVLSALCLVAFCGGLTVLWLQYARRSTGAARAALGATLTGFALVLALLNWDAVFAVQQAASPGDPAAARFAIAPAPGCLQAQWLGAPDADPGDDDRERSWSVEQQHQAGFGALAFWTSARPEGLPPGWRVAVTHVDGHVLDGRGASLARLAPARFMPVWARGADGQAVARNAWLLPRTRFDRLAPQAKALRLDYQIALLAPVHQAEIAADGRPHDLPGLGSCAATARAGAIEVSCFKAGRQPDLFTARPAGAGQDQDVVAGWPSFAPGVLQLTAGKRHRMVLRRSEAAGTARVTLTAYEARAHAERHVRIPGLLGGPACRPADPA